MRLPCFSWSNFLTVFFLPICFNLQRPQSVQELFFYFSGTWLSGHLYYSNLSILAPDKLTSICSWSFKLSMAALPRLNFLVHFTSMLSNFRMAVSLKKQLFEAGSKPTTSSSPDDHSNLSTTTTVQADKFSNAYLTSIP